MIKRMDAREQWKALPLPIRGLLWGMGLGLAVGLAVAALTVPAYLSASQENSELLERGVVFSAAIGFPLSLLSGGLTFFGLPGWIAYMIVAPSLNGGVLGALVGAAVWVYLKRKASGVAAGANGV